MTGAHTSLDVGNNWKEGKSEIRCPSRLIAKNMVLWGHLRVDISSRFIVSHPGLLEINFLSWRKAGGNLQALWEDCSVCKSALWIGRLLKFGDCQTWVQPWFLWASHLISVPLLENETNFPGLLWGLNEKCVNNAQSVIWPQYYLFRAIPKWGIDNNFIWNGMRRPERERIKENETLKFFASSKWQM